MKRNMFKTVLCSLLIAALLAASVPALAASKVAYILKVSVPGSPGTYMRSGSSKAGGTSNITGSLKNGTKVLYWGVKSGQMLKVMSANGKTGYVYQGNLKSYGAVRTNQLYATTGKTTVYKRSGSKMVKKGTVGQNIPVILFSTNNGWAYVRSLSGASAYVKASSLKKVG